MAVYPVPLLLRGKAGSTITRVRRIVFAVASTLALIAVAAALLADANAVWPVAFVASLVALATSPWVPALDREDLGPGEGGDGGGAGF